MKRILVISNEPFSGSSSNGRTLMNMMMEYDRNAIAQFYIHGTPDPDFCKNNFRVSDRDAVNAFLHRRKRVVESSGASVAASQPVQQRTAETPVKKLRRSSRNLLLRDMVWHSGFWWKKDFDRFLADFAPEVVLLQAGDAPFMYRIARKIAKRFSAALVMFNTENYVLKKHMYNDWKQDGVWHDMLQSVLRKEYANFMKRVDFCIYGTDQLNEDYQQTYPHPGKSAVLYTVSDLLGERQRCSDQSGPLQVVYCGNLGVGRAEPMAQLAEVLHEVDPKAVLHIYGTFKKEDEKRLVCAAPGVEYHGVVDYSLIPDIMRGADLNLHCENPDRLENLRTAFSTKIADCLAVGVPFLVFADKKYPFVKYLQKHDCAHVAGDREELKQVLTRCREDMDYRWKYVDNAMKTAAENHSVAGNCRKFNEIIQAL